MHTVARSCCPYVGSACASEAARRAGKGEGKGRGRRGCRSLKGEVPGDGLRSGAFAPELCQQLRHGGAGFCQLCFSAARKSTHQIREQTLRLRAT